MEEQLICQNKKPDSVTNRVYNFNAGPAVLPLEVLQQVQQELLNWQDTGMSIMEISHRSPEFEKLAAEINNDVRQLLNVPNNYKILLMQGGGRGQFAAVPMNLMDGYNKAAYVLTGLWSQMAAKEAEYYGKVQIAADSAQNKFTTIPAVETWKYDKDCAYLFYTDNETINGVEFANIPQCELPLVSDMSSNILTRHFDVSKFGLIFACAQKNLGPAGVTLVIIREDLLKRKPIATTPNIFRYQLELENDSMLNTPATFSWYVTGLVLKWIKEQGGLKVIEQRNHNKAKKLYDFIDQDDFYNNKIDPRYRSRMNVVVNLPNEDLEKKFIAEAKKENLEGLKGHRLVGGIRASIYNGMPEKGVDLLVEFMKAFTKKYG